MTRWAVIFEDTPKMLEVRAQTSLRDAHVSYAQAHPELLIGGGLKPDIDQPFSGALWIVDAKSKSDVVQLVLNDPFYFPEHRNYKIYTWGKILENQGVTL